MFSWKESNILIDLLKSLMKLGGGAVRKCPPLTPEEVGLRGGRTWGQALGLLGTP